MGDFNPQLPTKYNGTNKYVTFFVTRNRSPTGADYRQPETGTLYALGTVWQTGKNPTTGVQGDLWMLSKIVANVAYWVQVAGGGVGPLLGLTTPQGLSPVFPNGMGLIDLLEGAGISITGGVNNVTIANTGALNDYHVARYIVSAGGAADGANYTTLPTAYAAAVAAGGNQTVFLQPGTYSIGTQTLSPGVNISAFTCDAFTPNVTLSGTLSLTTAGTVSLSGLNLQTNSSSLASVTGSAASVLKLRDCYLDCLNSTGITFSSSSASSAIELVNCQGNIATTGISLFTHSSAGTLTISNTRVRNTGGSDTASTVSAGVCNISYSDLLFPIISSLDGAMGCGYSNFNTEVTNTISLTLGGSGIQSVKYCGVQSGNASAISISTIGLIQKCEVNSTNTNAITGAGAINYSDIVFTGTSTTINTTTQTGSGTLQGSKNTAPAAGFLGEVKTNSASGVPLANVTPANATSLALTPGVWDIDAWAFIGNTGAGTAMIAQISGTSATFTGVAGIQWDFLSLTATALNYTLKPPKVRAVISANTTYYLVVQSNFTTGASGVNGVITATRVG